MKPHRKKKPGKHQPDLQAISSTSSSSAVPPMPSNPPPPPDRSSRVLFSVNVQECVTIVMLLLIFSGLSICVGVAAGISISISYFDINYRQHYMYGHGILQRRVTDVEARLDNQKRVLHTTSMGHTTILPVVDVEQGADGSSSSSQVYHSEVDVDLPRLQLEDWIQTPPKVCSDGRTVGYDNWYALRRTVNDANLYAAERYTQWRIYLQKHPDVVFDNPKHYYEEEIVLTICPNAILRGGHAPIYVNTENLVIQCENCVISKWGSHFSFLPDAKNVRLVGLTLEYATMSSLVFRHDGAEVHIEDCLFRNNRGWPKNQGTVVIMNSTSTVHITRSFVDSISKDDKKSALAIHQTNRLNPSGGDPVHAAKESFVI